MGNEVTVSGDDVTRALHDEWCEMRNDALYYDCVVAVIRFARCVGLLDDDGHELWIRRLSTCPGHDDEGGRSWCAFCGDLGDDGEAGGQESETP